MKIKEIYKVLLQYKIQYVIIFFMICLDAIATFYYPEILQNIIDNVLPERNWKKLLCQILLLGICQITSIGASFFVSYLFYKVTNNFLFQLKNKIINAMFMTDGIKIREKSKKFLACMGADINNIQLLTSRMMADFLMEIITMIITVAIIFRINKYILILIVIIYPLLIGVQKKLNHVIKKNSKLLMESVDCENLYVKELASYITEFILLDAKEYYVNKFNKNENELLKNNILLNINLEINTVIPRCISMFSYIIVLIISGYLIMINEMSTGEFMIVVLYTQRIFSPLSFIMTVCGQIQKTKVSIKRISDIL